MPGEVAGEMTHVDQGAAADKRADEAAWVAQLRHRSGHGRRGGGRKKRQGKQSGDGELHIRV